MEAKLRKESETVLEKMFRRHDKKGTGFIRSDLMPRLLSSLNSDIKVNEDDLRSMVMRFDPDETGQLDFDAFSQISLHFLLKQTRRASLVFGGQKEIPLSYFEDAPVM